MNYCYDECRFNKCNRKEIKTINELGEESSRTVSTESNKRLQCVLGYSQTVNSHSALLNSIKQKARICPTLTKKFILKGV